MVTKRKIRIPIFDYALTIVVFDDWQEIKRAVSPEERDFPSRAITISGLGSSLMMINSKSFDSIVHECGHVKNALWMHIGYRPMADNDEVDQYLVTYLFKKVRDVFYLHHKRDIDDIMRDTY